MAGIGLDVESDLRADPEYEKWLNDVNQDDENKKIVKLNDDDIPY